MKAARLLVISQSFPYGNRIDFLDDEIWLLADAFADVVVAPTAPVAGAPCTLPDNVHVDLSLAPMLSRVKRLEAMLNPASLVRAVKELRVGGTRVLHPKQVARALLSVGGAAAVSTWYAQRSEGAPSLVYSYWLTEAVIGVRRADERVPIVSRVHGGDLYLERHPRCYIPQHAAALRACDAIASVSECGRCYLEATYPDLVDRLLVKRLGIQRFPRSSPSDDGVVRVLTCSSLTDVKRPLLAAESIARLAADRRVEWHHFGDGPLRDDMERLIEQYAPPSAKSSNGGLEFTLHGSVPNSTVAQYFETHSVDVFLNTSRSEGVAVSMMEALSAGVPIVATDVGGTSEIVQDGNGILVAADADASQIADILAQVAENPGSADRRIEFWANNYDAASNYLQFASWLSSFVEGSDT